MQADSEDTTVDAIEDADALASTDAADVTETTAAESAETIDAADGEPVQDELIQTGALQRNIEAVLFVASEAMSIKALAKLTGAEESDVTTALANIDRDFAERGLVLREVAGGYRFASSPAARAAVEAYLLPPKTNLSPAALETLAIVAYNEPVTKTQVEEIRGVSADSVIATLLDRRFIAESGRKESPGRPMLYKTTSEFLEAFGLNSLGDLPPVDLDAMQSRDLELPMTNTEPAGEAATLDDAAAAEDAASDEAVAPAEETPADESAPTPPDQEAEELSLA
jgi:segregation and condensation protein B